MYNGIDYVKQYTPNAVRRDFQVGSTFKPFVFTSAVENHSETQSGQMINPNTRYDGTSERPVQGWSGGRYAPENEDHRDYGHVTVREATDKSINAVYAQMAVDVGSDKVKQTAIDLGLSPDTPELTPSPSIALGVATASPLDMAEAYATLANHGRHSTYTLVEKVMKDGKQEVELPERREHQAVSRESADTTTSVLRSVVQNGTATAAQAAGRPAAAKTGTAEEDTAAWFMRLHPDLATVVAVMGQDPKTAAHKPLYGAMGLARINGGGAPAEIWSQYTRNALKGEPAADFDLQLQDGADVTAPPSSDASDEPGDGDESGSGEASDGPGDADEDGTGSETPGDSDSGSTPPGDDGGTESDPRRPAAGPPPPAAPAPSRAPRAAATRAATTPRTAARGRAAETPTARAAGTRTPDSPASPSHPGVSDRRSP